MKLLSYHHSYPMIEIIMMNILTDEYWTIEESMSRIKEEEERRKEVATKFQTTLSEVSSLLQQNNEKNNKLRDENSEMATKLQMLCDQYTLREQHLDKLGNNSFLHSFSIHSSVLLFDQINCFI